MLFVGMDISKRFFDVAVLSDEHYQTKQFKNKTQGFRMLLKWIKPLKQKHLFCLEATGVYGLELAKFLYRQNQKIIVVNPIKIHAFAKMEMSRNKTDKADSMSIARYAKHLHDKGDIDKNLFIPKAKAFEQVQALVTRLDQLDKSRTQENNRLGVSQDQTLKKQVDLLKSIDGLGDKTAWSILAYLGDRSLYNLAKQVSSYAGLNPRIEQSGSSIQRSSLSKMGNSRLRKSLYMPALVAVMRKLIVIAYGVLKSQKPFDVNYAK